VKTAHNHRDEENPLEVKVTVFQKNLWVNWLKLFQQLAEPHVLRLRLESENPDVPKLEDIVLPWQLEECLQVYFGVPEVQNVNSVTILGVDKNILWRQVIAADVA
jgi:hypothetical protein